MIDKETVTEIIRAEVCLQVDRAMYVMTEHAKLAAKNAQPKEFKMIDKETAVEIIRDEVRVQMKQAMDIMIEHAKFAAENAVLQLKSCLDPNHISCNKCSPTPLVKQPEAFRVTDIAKAFGVAKESFFGSLPTVLRTEYAEKIFRAGFEHAMSYSHPSYLVNPTYVKAPTPYPYLGLATTEELLFELRARAEAGGYARYRPVESMKSAQIKS